MTDGGRNGGEALRTRALILSDGRRTSARLEAPLWRAYDDVCEETRLGRNTLSQLIDARRPAEIGMTSALRVFLLSYYRSAAGREAGPAAAQPNPHLAAALDVVGTPEPVPGGTLPLTARERGAADKQRRTHA